MTEQEPQTIVALFATLPAATEALDRLQSEGVPYSCLAMSDHRPAEYADLPAHIATDQQLWAIAAHVDEALHQLVIDTLRAQRPLALGHSHADTRAEATRGSVAWGHYVFETSAPTAPIGESAGTTGVSGIATSGVFGDDALAEGRPKTTAKE